MELNETKIREILQGTNIEAILEFVENFNVSDKNVSYILSAFNQLEALHYKQLPELVFRYCVKGEKKANRTVRHSYLDFWLQRNDFNQRDVLIQEALKYLNSSNQTELVEVLRTVWTIGYRAKNLERKLKSIAGFVKEIENNDLFYSEEVQGFALTVLAHLGYANQKAITKKLHERLERNGYFLEPDCWTAKIAGTPEMLSALVEAASSNETNTYFSAIVAIVLIYQRFPRSAQDVWIAFLSLQIDGRFLFESTIAEELDYPDVSKYFLKNVIEAFNNAKTKNTSIPTNILLKANLPKQFKGLFQAKSDLSKEDLNILKELAITATKNESYYQTSESIDKEHAWDVILRLGLIEAIPWLPEAMKNERNYTLIQLAKFAGYLQAFDAAELLEQLIADETLDSRYGQSCLEYLGLLGKENTISALLNSKVYKQKWSDGYIISDLIEALSSVCMTINSCRKIWNTLRDKKIRQEVREACAYTIEDLSGIENSPMPPSAELISHLQDEDPNSIIFQLLMYSLHRYFNEEKVKDFLFSLGKSEIESKALDQTLAVAGLLQELPVRLEKLGIVKIKGNWTITSQITNLISFIVNSLYRADESFESCILQILNESKRENPAYEILLNLRKSQKVSNKIKKAIKKWVFKSNDYYSADKIPLETLARVYPTGLLSNSTVKRVLKLNSRSRLYYLKALKIVMNNSKYNKQIAAVTRRFLTDVDRNIRRVAAGIISKTDIDILKAEINLFSRNDSKIDQAFFMIESAFYLDNKNWKKIEKRGIRNRESLVRKLTKAVSQERKNTQLANIYINKLLKSKDLLKTWHLGQAISKLGNEEIADKFYKNLPKEVYIRSYFIDLAKKIEKNIEKIRKEEDKKFQLPNSIS